MLTGDPLGAIKKQNKKYGEKRIPSTYTPATAVKSMNRMKRKLEKIKPPVELDQWADDENLAAKRRAKSRDKRDKEREKSRNAILQAR